jgi:hypothetical protein
MSCSRPTAPAEDPEGLLAQRRDSRFMVHTRSRAA